MNAEGQRACPSCGNEFSGAMESCPVCMLRKALAGGVESGESSTPEDMVKPATEQAVGPPDHPKSYFPPTCGSTTALVAR
jgi:hypothetical protein